MTVLTSRHPLQTPFPTIRARAPPDGNDVLGRDFEEHGPDRVEKPILCLQAPSRRPVGRPQPRGGCTLIQVHPHSQKQEVSRRCLASLRGPDFSDRSRNCELCKSPKSQADGHANLPCPHGSMQVSALEGISPSHKRAAAIAEYSYGGLSLRSHPILLACELIRGIACGIRHSNSPAAFLAAWVVRAVTASAFELLEKGQTWKLDRRYSGRPQTWCSHPSVRLR